MFCPPKAANSWVEVTLAKLQAAWGTALGWLFGLYAAGSAARVVRILECNIDFFKLLGGAPRRHGQTIDRSVQARLAIHKCLYELECVPYPTLTPRQVWCKSQWLSLLAYPGS